MNADIPILKKPLSSRKEFVWKIQFPDIKRYDEIRGQYRSYLTSGQNKADDLLIEEMARRMPRKGVILDVASGMGTLLLALAKSRRSAQILGTDVDETPLRGAMLKLKERGSYGLVSLCVTDAKHLAVGSKKVACVVSHFGFNNIPKTKLALSEAARVLKAKDKLVFSILELKDDSRSYRLAEKLGYGEIGTEAKLVAALEQTGFQIDTVERFYSGKWLHNPMDRLPLEGDWFAHSLIQARVR